MIDRSLNYGRHIIEQYLRLSGQYHSILDIGAGDGFDLTLARNINPEALLYAIEASPENVHIISEKDITVHALNIERDVFPFADNSVDIVIANQILEHVKEIFWIFHEISRALKVGGKLILGVPNLASFHNRLLLLVGKQPTPIQLHSAHVRGFTKSGLLNFLNIYAGYNVIDFRGSNFYPFPPFLAKPLAKMFPSLAWGIFIHLNKTKEYSNEFMDYLDREKLETFYYRGSKA
jgi:SAM-dependent methyltransferase